MSSEHVASFCTLADVGEKKISTKISLLEILGV